MHPIRKSFLHDPLFPFDYVYKDRKSPQKELPDHFHDRYELIFVHGGSGTQFVDQKFYEMREGDLFIVPGNTIHRAFPDPDNLVTSSAVYFSPALLPPDASDDGYSAMRFFERSRRNKRYKLVTAAGMKLGSERYLADIHGEMTAQRAGYRQAVRLLLQMWLLELNRFYASAELISEPHEAKIGPLWMKDLLLYISQHPDGDLSLSALAARAAVTPAHFSRVFRQLTGMNVTDYVNAKRIAHAKELLFETGDSVASIAEKCSFDSLPHFHRVFKQLTGLTPAVYRRMFAGGDRSAPE